MSDIIRIKRGLKANLPVLSQGEQAYCTDTDELFVGGTSNNVLLNFKHIVDVTAPPFNAKGDGTTDDTTAINTAITFAQSKGNRTLFFPIGTYKISSTLDFNSVNAIGVGPGRVAFGSLVDLHKTKFLWAGNTTTPMIRYKTVNLGINFSGFEIDGNGVAAIGLEVDSVSMGKFENIAVVGCTSKAIELQASTDTNSWNLFQRIFIVVNHANVVGIRVGGNYPGSNSCHNTFQQIQINFAGTSARGMVLDDCDNNTFMDVYMFRTPATGASEGVYLDTSVHAGMPVSNTFIHLQCSDGGFNNNGANYNKVVGYALDNGEPLPVLGGGVLIWDDYFGRQAGLRQVANVFHTPGLNMGGQTTVTAGNAQSHVTLPNAEPDNQYTIVCSPISGPTTAVCASANAGTTSFDIYINPTQATDLTVAWFMFRA